MCFYFVPTQMENYTPEQQLTLWGGTLLSSERLGTTTPSGQSSMIPGGSMVGGACKNRHRAGVAVASGELPFYTTNNMT